MGCDGSRSSTVDHSGRDENGGYGNADARFVIPIHRLYDDLHFPGGNRVTASCPAVQIESEIYDSPQLGGGFACSEDGGTVLSLEILAAGSIVVALNLYMLMGGADYGGGVWDLLASGSRARQQRDLIAHAIGPVWEANHVWLILAITVLFTAFPLAFSTITTFLHVPLLLMLIGIVFRGSAFAFRSYDLPNDRPHAMWSSVFSVSSPLTPILLGITLGSIASGRLMPSPGNFRAAFIDPWLAPFPLAVGSFALALFAFLAAVYLTLEAEDS